MLHSGSGVREVREIFPDLSNLCGLDEGLAQSGCTSGAKLKLQVNSPEKRAYLLRPGLLRWLLLSGTLLDSNHTATLPQHCIPLSSGRWDLLPCNTAPLAQASCGLRRTCGGWKQRKITPHLPKARAVFGMQATSGMPPGLPSSTLIRGPAGVLLSCVGPDPAFRETEPELSARV